LSSILKPTENRAQNSIYIGCASRRKRQLRDSGRAWWDVMPGAVKATLVRLEHRPSARRFVKICKGNKLADVPAESHSSGVVNLSVATMLGFDVPVAARPRRRGDRIGMNLMRCIRTRFAFHVI
jgi:hypothetical protein